MAMKFGRKPTRLDRRTLRFCDYLPSKLPTPPATIDHSSEVAKWLMDGNDQYGDCVMACLAHQILDWTTYAGSPRQPTEAQVVAEYLKLSPNDDGLVILDTLNEWRQAGFWSDKIDAFVSLDAGDLTQAKLGIQYFGSINIGLALPDKNTFGPWDAVQGAPDPNNGHCVALVGYDATGFFAVTWGSIIHMSWAFYQKYSGPGAQGEAYAILSRDWLNAQGLDVDGFDYPTLASDLNQITGSVAPPPPPPPPPQPPQPPQPPTPPGPGCLPVVIAVLTCAAMAYHVAHPSSSYKQAAEAAIGLQTTVQGLLP